MGQKNELAHRIAKKTIKLVDSLGVPVAGREISIKQTNHQFLFG